MRDAKPADNRGRRDRIWRRNNRAECKRSGQGQRRHDGMRDPGDCQCCRKHQADRQQKYRSQIPPKITPRCEQRGWINQRWQNKVEHYVGIQSDLRQPRHETQSEPAKNEHDRVRQRNLVRQHGQSCDGCEQKNNDFCLVHVRSVAVGGSVTSVFSGENDLINRGQRPRL